MTEAKPSTTVEPAVHPVDRAIVALSAVAFCLAVVLHDWAQAAAVAMLLVVTITRVNDPDAAWVNWMPRLGRS